MADFNEISSASPVTVTSVVMTKLCFLDGKLLPSDDYVLSGSDLALTHSGSETASLYYNFNAATAEEYQRSLCNAGVEIVSAQLLTTSRLLVFVEGVLLDPSAYEITKETVLRDDTEVTVYGIRFLRALSTEAVSHIILYCTNTDMNSGSIPYDQALWYDIDYSTKDTLIFKNGVLLPFNAIMSDKGKVRLNVELKPDDELRYYKLPRLTESLHFIVSPGYLSYGPYDVFESRVPLSFDTTLTFPDQAIMIVDNIREGFILKSNGEYDSGEAIIVDTDFEKRVIKAISVAPFSKTVYQHTEYHFEVPRCKSIVDYLAKFDQDTVLLPEILTIFQRVILDEINDSIQRIRDSRSLDRVDSKTIYGLFGFLGMDITINNLSLRQRRELLAELNNFYARVGTKESFNIMNILQTDFLIINIEQLFTPSTSMVEKSVIYDYFYEIPYNIEGTAKEVGSGYVPNTRYGLYDDDLNDTGLVVKITSVDGNGGIGTFDVLQPEGVDEIPTANYNLVVASSSAMFSCSSVPVEYNYNYTITGGTGFEPKNVAQCVTGDGPFSFKVTSVDENGAITGFELNKGTPTSGNRPYDTSLSPILLYLDETNELTLTVSSSPSGNRVLLYSSNSEDATTENPEVTIVGTSFTARLDPGQYDVEMSGAGGTGACIDSSHGGHFDTARGSMYAGSSAELVTSTFLVENSVLNTLACVVGQPGTKTLALANYKAATGGAGGVGYGNGVAGAKALGEYYSLVTGGGGGSTGISVSNGTEIVARGGNGGGCTGHDSKGWFSGGAGGSGGVSSGSGAAGGAHAVESWWDEVGGHPGEKGWIRIWKKEQKYTCLVAGDMEGVAAGEVFKSADGVFTATVTDPSRFPSSAIIEPTTGYPYVNETMTLISTASVTPAELTIDYGENGITYRYDSVITDSNLSDYVTGTEFMTSWEGVVYTTTLTGWGGDGSATFSTSPARGTTVVNVRGEPTQPTVGEGGKIRVTSQKNDQSSSEQEYIDFFTREELGGILHTEFRADGEDYGRVVDGTENSPYPWQVGIPDVDYGDAVEDLNATLKDYGLVTEANSGEYVRWWEWDRGGYMPTNHVRVETKISPTNTVTGVVERFYTQFYQIASTVIYLHDLIQSLYFGNDTTDANDPAQSAGVFAGIMCAPTVVYEEYVFTSDPSIQAPV